MSSSNSEIPISELIKHIRHSFLERDFVKVQTILMEREKDLKIEIDNLMRDRDSAKEKVRLFERTRDSAKLKRWKLEEDFRKSRRKCEELEENIARLQEEIKMSNDREKRAEEQRDNIFAVHTKMTLEKTRSISELKTKNLENERLIGEIEGLAREKLDAVKKIEELRAEIIEANKTADDLRKKESQEIEGLARQKLDADKKIEELRAEIIEANKTVDELRKKESQEIEGLTREKLDAVKTIEELRAKIIEANKTVDELRKKESQPDKFAELQKKIEEGISDILIVKQGGISDLAHLYNRISKLATSEERANSGFAGSEGKKDSSGSGSSPDEILAVNATSPTTGKRNSVFPMKDDRNSANPSTRGEDDDARNTIKTPRVSQLVRHSTQAESNKRKEPLDSGIVGASANGMRLMPIARCSTKSTCPPSTGHIIEIIDSDDETNPDGKARISNRVSDSNPGKKLRNLVQSPLSNKRSKRNRTDSGEDFIVNSTSKKRNMCPSDGNNVSIQRKENQTPKPTTACDRTDCSSSKKRAGDKAGPACGTQTLVEKHNNGLKDGDSESSDDESLSDSRMVDLVASLHNNNIGRKIKYEADMLMALQPDEEFCMSAVCALYRQEVVAKKMKGRSDSSKNRGFSPIDSVSGCALAEYLIDGDKKLRLRKSVSEVKKQRPDVISQCRKLANKNVDKLFEIYRSGDDPLFR